MTIRLKLIVFEKSKREKVETFIPFTSTKFETNSNQFRMTSILSQLPDKPLETAQKINNKRIRVPPRVTLGEL